MIKELIKIANKLDRAGLIKEADFLDRLIKKSYLGPAADTLSKGLEVFDELTSENIKISYDSIKGQGKDMVYVNPKMEYMQGGTVKETCDFNGKNQYVQGMNTKIDEWKTKYPKSSWTISEDSGVEALTSLPSELLTSETSS